MQVKEKKKDEIKRENRKEGRKRIILKNLRVMEEGERREKADRELDWRNANSEREALIPMTSFESNHRIRHWNFYESRCRRRSQ